MGATANPHDDHLRNRPLAGGGDVLPLASGGAGAAGSEAPTGQLVAATMGEKCVTCGAPFASDQRYCVNCGERRGRPRFSYGSTMAASAEAPAAPPPEPRRSRASSGGTMIAGIGTLLLAMGVGVLIGHNGNSNASPRANQPIQVITGVAGTGGTAATPGATASHSTTSSGSGSKHKGAKTKASTSNAPPPKAVQQKAAAAASKVLGGGSNLAPPTVKVGQSGSGAGFSKKTHKFTGQFFGQ